jgi:hypothetical protein
LIVHEFREDGGFAAGGGAGIEDGVVLVGAEEERGHAGGGVLSVAGAVLEFAERWFRDAEPAWEGGEGFCFREAGDGGGGVGDEAIGADEDGCREIAP